MGNNQSMEAAVDLAPGNIQIRSTEESASMERRNEADHGNEIIADRRRTPPPEMDEADGATGEDVTSGAQRGARTSSRLRR